jgi:hypothetical protein
MYLAWEQNDGTEVKQHFNPKDIPYSEETLDVAKREAYNGEYEIYDDGQLDPSLQPTQLDRIEAQITYTAMMTDTLLEV